MSRDREKLASYDRTEETYQRVLVAVRYTEEGCLYLKLFKQVPVKQIDVLLPNATCKMDLRDKAVIGAATTAGVGVASIKITAAMVALPTIPLLVGNTSFATGALPRPRARSLPRATPLPTAPLTRAHLYVRHTDTIRR